MRSRHLRSITLAVTLACAPGCGDSRPVAPPPPPAQPGQPGQPTGQSAAGKAPATPTPTQLLMREHFEKATEARRALIADDMEGARAAMAWLANNDPSHGQLPAALQPHVAGMREKAGSFAAATTFSQAGEAYASMLTQCAECHGAADHALPRFADVPAPQGTELRDRMHKHAWAADRMWEGLVLRDQARYDGAARSLADVVVRVDELPANEADPARVQAVADNVRALAAAGLAATDWPARGETYGKFLATCATCHRIMGVGEVVSRVLHGQPAVLPTPAVPAPAPAAPAPTPAAP